MGWCSATKHFDAVADKLVEIEKSLADSKLDEEVQKGLACLGRYILEEVLETLRDTLEEGDWDCQCESKYWNHPKIGPLLGNDEMEG
jgi:hypothetical protein